MAIRLTLIFISSLAAVLYAYGEEVCYSVVGCFNNDPPFDNADDELPSNPIKVGTKFHLYTRERADIATSLVYTQPISITQSYFSSDRPTKVIVHGLNNDETSEWIIDMRKAFLKQGDYNVIAVHWAKGARLTNYAKASANVRLVATQVKVLLNLLQRVAGLKLMDVHLIGHSLGAHTSGYVGTLMGDQIGRITGLDPADPNFEHLPYIVRLDPSDAYFVDVIHTDGREFERTVGFGLSQPSGHIDFYVNGGENQKGCEDGISGFVDGIFKAVRGQTDSTVTQSAGQGAACSHSRAHSIFIESINSNCRFISFPCDNYDMFLQGQCYDCAASGCSAAGLYADHYFAAKGKHYLTTFAKSPFCGSKYFNLFLEVSRYQSATKGDIYVQLRNMNGLRTRRVSLMGRDTEKIGQGDLNIPIVLDKSIQELDPDVLLIELTYKRRTGYLEFFSQAAKTFKVENVILTEVTTGKKFASRHQTRTLNHNVPNVITLNRMVVNGVTG